MNQQEFDIAFKVEKIDLDLKLTRSIILERGETIDILSVWSYIDKLLDERLILTKNLASNYETNQKYE